MLTCAWSVEKSLIENFFSLSVRMTVGAAYGLIQSCSNIRAALVVLI